MNVGSIEKMKMCLTGFSRTGLGKSGVITDYTQLYRKGPLTHFWKICDALGLFFSSNKLIDVVAKVGCT